MSPLLKIWVYIGNKMKDIHSRTQIVLPSFLADQPFYEYDNMRENYARKTEIWKRMGARNKWGKWNTNEGLSLENRARMRGVNEERMVLGVWDVRLEHENLRWIYSARDKQKGRKERGALETEKEIQ